MRKVQRKVTAEFLTLDEKTEEVNVLDEAECGYDYWKTNFLVLWLMSSVTLMKKTFSRLHICLCNLVITISSKLYRSNQFIIITLCF